MQFHFYIALHSWVLQLLSCATCLHPTTSSAYGRRRNANKKLHKELGITRETHGWEPPLRASRNRRFKRNALVGISAWTRRLLISPHAHRLRIRPTLLSGGHSITKWSAPCDTMITPT